MKIYTNLFPGGKLAALTMSYDDGQNHDRRLIDIFNKNGIKGTFHLNSSRMRTKGGCVTLAEVKDVYAGHEVSCHTFTHPFPIVCPDTTLVTEIVEDRKLLEQACGYTVRGMSYPYGDYSDKAIEVLEACGMRYSRTTAATNGFKLPENFMKWHPTCHHKANLKEMFDRLIAMTKKYKKHDVMYVWGHSYEFNNDNNWEHIEEFCEYASGREEIWYATNIEIYDYIKASNDLYVSVDGTSVYNPSNISVWVTAVDDDMKSKVVEIKPGENNIA